MENKGDTIQFTAPRDVKTAEDVLMTVYSAMREKGYDPVNQIVGYLLSGDPTYITSFKNARSIIMKAERDELVEELLTEYIRNNNWPGAEEIED